VKHSLKRFAEFHFEIGQIRNSEKGHLLVLLQVVGLFEYFD